MCSYPYLSSIVCFFFSFASSDCLAASAFAFCSFVNFKRFSNSAFLFAKSGPLGGFWQLQGACLGQLQFGFPQLQGGLKSDANAVVAVAKTNSAAITNDFFNM